MCYSIAPELEAVQAESNPTRSLLMIRSPALKLPEWLVKLNDPASCIAFSQRCSKVSTTQFPFEIATIDSSRTNSLARCPFGARTFHPVVYGDHPPKTNHPKRTPQAQLQCLTSGIGPTFNPLVKPSASRLSPCRACDHIRICIPTGVLGWFEYCTPGIGRS